MKAKLIINMPDKCKECNLSFYNYLDDDALICIPTLEDVTGLDNRPYYCPLEPIEGEA